MATPIDPRTDRPNGDHGTANDAINYTLSGADLGCPAEDFLRCWREGDLDEWPEFYAWLRKQEGTRH
jgi:hypothetical protein